MAYIAAFVVNTCIWDISADGGMVFTVGLLEAAAEVASLNEYLSFTSDDHFSFSYAKTKFVLFFALWPWYKCRALVSLHLKVVIDEMDGFHADSIYQLWLDRLYRGFEALERYFEWVDQNLRI